MSAPLWLNGPPSKILLATDLSARCDRALARAIALAESWNAVLVIAHVMETRLEDLHSLENDDAPSWRRGPDRAAALEAQIRKELAPLYQGPLVVRVTDGEAAQRIEEIARDEACGLIISGLARARTFERSILGSTVERLLRHAPAPVLVVRNRAAGAYRAVVAATDFSDSSQHALEAALKFFPNAGVTLFHGFEIPFETLTTRTDWSAQIAVYQAETAEPFLAKSEIATANRARIQLLIERGAPEVLLAAYAADKPVDLIVTGSHGRSAMFDILIGSIAKRIVENAPTDVLIVREPRAARR